MVQRRIRSGARSFRGPGIRDKAREFPAILDSRRRLDPAGDVERVGLERRRLGHIFRHQSARNEHAAQIERAQRVEPPRPAGTAEKLRMKRVNQNKIGLDFIDIRGVERLVGTQA